MLKPFVPLVSDLLAHTFFESEHVITVHHDHGKDHLHYELKKVADENNEKNNSVILKSDNELSFHLAVQYNVQFCQNPVNKNFHSKYAVSLPLISTAIQLPPPKA